MPITISMPDGNTLEFPDGTSQADVQEAVSGFKPDISLGQALSSAMQPSVLKRSGKQFATDMIQPFLHPVDTYNAVKNVGKGALQKLVPGEQPEEKYANAAGDFLYDRFGSWRNIKNTIATDPVGSLADASMLLTGGGSAAARAPGVLGKVGAATKMVGGAIDPIRAVGKAAGYVGSVPLGLTSGAGVSSVREALAAGAEGGARGEAFASNMRGGPTNEVVQDALGAVQSLRGEMQGTYLANKKNWALVNKPIDWKPINDALEKIGDVRSFRGASGTAPLQVLDDAAQTARLKVLKTVNDWQMLDPAEFHTTVGLDALKQKIGSELDNIPYTERSARKVYGEVYNAIRQQLVKQAPSYAAAMKHYEDSIALVREMEQTLSLNPRASVDTQMRKLQSIMRNNANTNYGRRVDLGKILEQAGAKHLMSKLAGQTMSSWTPRGLQAVVGSTSLGAGATGFASFLDPTYLAWLASQSPRIVGEGAYFGGKYGYPIGAGALSAGRLTEDR